ncbi:MAG: MmgE/PrpD family protein [Proteobacteria bacterium]|nr:MmgE/PrpD family protein [Burkholderiales bacterium]
MLLERLADYAIHEQTSRLPDEVWHHAKRCVIDWSASLLPGMQCAPATVLIEALADELDHGRATLPVYGRNAPSRTAALIMGAGSHTVEFDDIYRAGGYHPGSPTISAALAVAQSVDASGEDFLRGVIVGYEISTRVCEAVMPSHYVYWHTTATIGCIGAAAAAATILKLNREQFVHALASVTTHMAGLQQAFRSEAMTKPMHAAHAADVGVMSALAAKHGLTGVPDMLEGELGFGAAMSENPDWSKATDGLGERYNITEITFKNHGSCGHTFASIDGALVLQQQHGFAAEQIASVRLETYGQGIEICGRDNVSSAFEGRFSLKFTVASALVHGSVRLNAYTPERLNDARVKDLMTRIELVEDPVLTAGYPKQRASRVKIVLTDGRQLEFFQPYRKGDPEQLLTDDEVNAKFMELSTPVLGEAKAKALLAALWSTETAKVSALPMKR